MLLVFLSNFAHNIIVASAPRPEYLTFNPAASPVEIVNVLLVISADIATPSNVAEPVTPVVVIPAPVVPTVIEPVELEIVWFNQEVTGCNKSFRQFQQTVAFALTDGRFPVRYHFSCLICVR